MPDENELESQYRREWLLVIGQRLRAEYDALAQPLPPHLLALVKQFDDPRASQAAMDVYSVCERTIISRPSSDRWSIGARKASTSRASAGTNR
jgi:hypothetical protein